MSGKGARSTYVKMSLEDLVTKELKKINKLIDMTEGKFEDVGDSMDSAKRHTTSLTQEIRKTSKSFDGASNEAKTLTQQLTQSRASASKVATAVQKVDNSLNQSEQEAAALRKEVCNADGAMKSLKGSADGLKDSLDKSGASASNLKSMLGGLASAATISGLIATVSDYETSMDRIAAKTGLTGQILEDVEFAALDVFNKGIGQDLTLVSDVVSKIKTTLGDINGGGLSEFGAEVITIADLMGESADNVVWTVKNMVSNFDDIYETDALDLITVAFQRTGDYSQDLLDTFKEYSPYFSKMGLSAQEFTSILITGAEQGAWNMDKVGDAVKEFGILGMDGSKSTAEGFALIGLEAEMMAQQIAKGGDSANQAFYATIAALSAMDDEVARNQAGTALFGTMWEDVREDVILAMGDAKNAVLDFEGAAATATAVATDNFGTDLLSTVREFKSEVATMFSSGAGAETLATGLDLVKTTLDGAVTGLSWVIDNKDTLIAATSGIAAGFMVMKGISLVNGMLALYQGSAFASTVATHGFNAALRANPIGMVVTAIGLLVAGGVLLYQNWDVVKAKAGELWETTKDIFGKIYDWGAEKIQGVTSFFGGLVDKVSDFIGRITSFKPPEWVSTIGGAIGGAVSKAKNLVQGSHATGLAQVGYDGYVAELHKDESVLTAQQSDALRATGMLTANGDGTPNLNLQPLSYPTPTPVQTQTPQVQSVTTNSTPSVQITMPIELTVQGNADSSTIAEIRVMLQQIEATLGTKVRQILEEIFAKELAGLEG